MGQWDADDLAVGLRGRGEVVRNCGRDLIEARIGEPEGEKVKFVHVDEAALATVARVYS